MPVNTASLKAFAPAMRRQLLEAVGRKLDLLLHSQTADTLVTYAPQIADLREQEATSRAQLLERVAYTWFNRLCALRYLDARGWHPFGCKVLMPASGAESQPELLKLMRSGSLPAALQNHTHETRLNGLLDGQIQPAIAGADPQGEVYRELVLAVCRSYNELLPSLFEELDDATELLLPDDLLTEGSIAGGFRREISDEDCEDVEIIGWLYQFYISEKKDQVIGKVVKSEDIPAATQLFTPNWIVKYMVQNSLGAQWLATYPSSALKGQMEYYIKPAEQTDEVNAQLAAITPESLNPEELTLIDPACGSGHILVEAYEVIKAIYLERGYPQREIPQLILEKNLFGLDIDERAAQLTSFALMMKGREDDRRLFERGIQLNVMALLNSDELDVEGLANAVNLAEYGLKLADLVELKQLFEHATTFGSLIQVPDGLAEKLPALRRLSEWKGQDMLVAKAQKTLGLLVRQVEFLASHYDAVVANPPYMGRNAMNSEVKKFVKAYFPFAKSDLFACFIQRGFELAKGAGFISMITMESWMFLASYEEFRKSILRQHTLRSLAHFPYEGKQPTAMGINFGVAVISTHNIYFSGYKGSYCCSRYHELAANGTPVEFPTQNERLKSVAIATFAQIPGCPIAYWLGESIIQIFSSNPPLGNKAVVKIGLMTSDNDKYLRYFWEVSRQNSCLNASTGDQAAKSCATWFPHNKGGAFRKWSGNRDYLVNWRNNGEDIKRTVVEKYPYLKGNPQFVVHDDGYYFRPSISWSETGSGKPSFRFFPSGFTFNVGGVCAFPLENSDTNKVLALCNSNFVQYVFQALNPTLHFGANNFRSLPAALEFDDDFNLRIDRLISIASDDWDSCETSWDFSSLLLCSLSSECSQLESAFDAYKAYSRSLVEEVQSLEVQNNCLFIDYYGIQNEIVPEVPIEQITLNVNPAHRYGGKLTEDELWIRFRQDTIKEFLSYAIGCMMGRYSLDQPGLILANAGDTLDNYYAIVGKGTGDLTFQPDLDGIIPVLDGEWFEDDIVARSREFLRICFPASSVNTDLAFIETALGKDIRKYFCTDFYKDHLQTYKKRPIYWLVQSPKKGFACLIYLHRYTKDTLNLVLNNYLRPYLQKLEARLAQLGLDQLNDALPARERTAARKEAEKITKVLKECQAWEQDSLLPLAQQRIELDLDDGVKVNYLKLQDVLAPIPGLAAKEE